MAEKGEGFPHLAWGLRSGGSAPSISLAQSAREVFPALRLGPTPSEVPSGPHGSWGHRREARGEQERKAGEALQDQRSGRGVEGVSRPTQAQEACWTPRWGTPPCKTKSERHAWAPSIPLSLSPTPYSPQGHFQPVGPKHRPHPPPKPCPCQGPTLHSQGLFHLFFFKRSLRALTLVCDLLVICI